MESLSSVAKPMVHQLYNLYRKTEEWIRSGGQSGLKQIRNHYHGTRNYHTMTVNDPHTYGGYRDLPAHRSDLGQGEMTVVINGVEFKTRALDYRPSAPHPTSGGYLDTVPLTYPGVPANVTSLATPEEQIEEMKKWYKAWMQQDESIRPYKNYFKAAMCYIEGWWESPADRDQMTEPNYSNIKSLQGLTWNELFNNQLFSSYAGYQDHDQQQAFLPKTLLEVEDNNRTRVAQWNSRVMCHQLKNDLPLNRLKVNQEFSLRYAFDMPYGEDVLDPWNRFTLVDDETTDHMSLLDDIMGEIPGLENYQTDLTDTAFDRENFDVSGEQPLKAGYYHRLFKTKDEKSDEKFDNRRSFNDGSVFFAINQQQNVSHVTAMDNCVILGRKTSCSKSWTQRWSYAIPLEIIYLTPVLSWNPYNIKYKGAAESIDGQSVTANGRNGSATQALAFDGSNDEHFYNTPAHFYHSTETPLPDGIPAALDANGAMRLVYPNGIMSVSSEIYGVGKARYRYPIIPVHHEGTPEWRALDAVRQMVVNPRGYRRLFKEFVNSKRDFMWFKMAPSIDRPEYGIKTHTHVFSIDKLQYEKLDTGRQLKITTSMSEGHNHVLIMEDKNKPPYVKIKKIDHIFKSPPDGHDFDVERLYLWFEFLFSKNKIKTKQSACRILWWTMCSEYCY